MQLVFDNNNIEIYLKPVGKTIVPTSPQELKAALLCIASFVVLYQAVALSHTDIRWTNVVMYEKKWILIDCFDFCSVMDTERLIATKRMRTRWMICYK